MCAGVGDGEQAVVEPERCWEAGRGVDPVHDAFRRRVRCHASTNHRLALEVVRAHDLDDRPVPKAHDGAGRESLPALLRRLGVVVALDPQAPADGKRPRGRRVGGRRDVVRPVRGVEDGRLQALDLEADRVGDGQDAAGGPVEVVAQGVLELLDFDGPVGLGHAEVREEAAQRLRPYAAASEAGDGGHPGVVPAGDVSALDELAELPLAHHRVVEVEARELVLVVAGLRDSDGVEVPVVERPVDVELQGAHRVRHALDGVALAVRPVVEWVDGPLRSAAVVLGVAADAVHQRVAELHVGVRHRAVLRVNLGPQHERPVGVLAVLHLLEQPQALLGRAVPKRRRRAVLEDGAAAGADLVLALAVDVGQSLPDELLRPGVELLEVVARVAHLGGLEAEPLDGVQQGIGELLALGLRVGVVVAQVRGSAEVLRQAEVEADRLRVADVRVAVGLRRESRHDARVALGLDVGGHDLADEVVLGLGAVHGRAGEDAGQ